ncbi:MAG: hypothetical protein Q4A66_06080 [Eubacteriales bacterium]|nr:hypothetical protein [Eubacteriales bacterium]
MNECEHPVEAQLTTGVHLNVRDIKPVDEFYHQHTCDYYEYTVCTLCNEPLSNMLMEEGRTHEALHEYEEYVCVECGEPELAVCPHPEEALVRYSAIRENVYDYDETYHVIETEEVEIVECELCKQSLSVTVVDCELDFFEHVYNRGGQCVCWHVNFCDHEGERSSDYAIYDWSFTSINDLFHTVNGKYCVTEYCEECDNALSTKVIDEDFTSIERHDFNEMGNCMYCDYAVSKRCEHPEESIITYDLPSVYHEIEVISSDADSHTISFSVNRTLYCTACNTTLETYKVDEIVTKTEPHMYIGALGSETCIFCGYENPCTHENERTIIIPLFCTVEDMTEETHTIRGSFTEVISCADCGCYDWDRATIKGPNELATAEHNLNEDGYCLVCGYNTAGEPVG